MEAPNDEEWLYIYQNVVPTIFCASMNYLRSQGRGSQRHDPRLYSITSRMNTMEGPSKKFVTEEEWNELFEKGNFKKEDMDMLVMDFLISKQLPHAAQTFQRESGCQLSPEDVRLMQNKSLIRDYILSHRIDEAIHHINQNFTMDFLIEKPQLKFQIEHQMMIELSRKGDFTAALEYSRNFIKWEKNEDENGNRIFQKICRVTMLLMLFGDQDSPAAYLLDPSNIFGLADAIDEAILSTRGRSKGKLIEKSVKLMNVMEQQLNKEAIYPHFDMIKGYPQRAPRRGDPDYVYAPVPVRFKSFPADLLDGFQG